jgi:hypothetical protein
LQIQLAYSFYNKSQTKLKYSTECLRKIVRQITLNTMERWYIKNTKQFAWHGFEKHFLWPKNIYYRNINIQNFTHDLSSWSNVMNLKYVRSASINEPCLLTLEKSREFLPDIPTRSSFNVKKVMESWNLCDRKLFFDAWWLSIRWATRKTTWKDKSLKQLYRTVDINLINDMQA